MTQLAALTNEKLTYSSKPSWVKEIWFSDNTPQRDNSQVNVQCLLVDIQTHLKSETTYYHYAFRILNSTGGTEIANQSIPFNPEYEELILHSFAGIRKGEKKEKLDSKKVKLLQRERGLEQGIYDGYSYATFFLEDLRKDDILELSYSLKGSNPILEGRFSTSFPLQYSSKVEKYYRRILLHSSRKYNLQHSHSEWKKYLQRAENEWIWNIEPSPPYQIEPNQPLDYSTNANAEVTEYQSWKEVAEWGIKHYVLLPNLRRDPKAKALIDQWKSSSRSQEELVLKALRFVQQEIRYLGMEIGIYSLKPTDSLEVFNRGFGDCKDKSHLLHDFLDQLGITSFHCLVNSHTRSATAKSLPSPLAFNHVILCVKLSGRSYFVDPTLTYQGGSLSESHCGDFGVGLLLSETSKNLILIPTPVLKTGIVTHVTYSLDYEPVEMSVRSCFFEREANIKRYMIHSQSEQDMNECYEQYYRSIYGPTKLTAPLKIDDNQEKNRLTIDEKYEFFDFWTYNQSKKTKEGLLYPFSMREFLSFEVNTDRKTPLAIPYPIVLKETIEIQFDLKKFKLKNKEIKHKAFTLTISSLKKRVGTFLFIYELRTHVQSLEPEELLGFSKKLEEAHEASHFICVKKGSLPKISQLSELTPFQKLGLVSLIIIIIRMIYMALL